MSGGSYIWGQAQDLGLGSWAVPGTHTLTRAPTVPVLQPHPASWAHAQQRGPQWAAPLPPASPGRPELPGLMGLPKRGDTGSPWLPWGGEGVALRVAGERAGLSPEGGAP